MQFSQIIGQTEVKERLIRSVKENRVSHAQLFLGPSGCGSLALALAYAQYIHCENRSKDDSCGECSSCTKHSKVIHPDLHFSYPFIPSKEKKIVTSSDELHKWREVLIANPYLTLDDWFDYLGVENQQPIIPEVESGEILRKLNLTAYEAEYKITIIWMAEKLHNAASNKLLKILEEPPEKTVFILLVENEDQLLRTIVSRTQLIKINRIDDESLMNVLIKKDGLTSDNARNITFIAEGNYNTAQQLIHKNEDAEFNLFTFQTWMRSALKFDINAINKLVNDFAELGRERQKNFLSYCMHLMRESLVINYADDAIMKVTDKEADFLKKFSPFIHAGNCLQFADAFNQAAGHIERNAHPKILFLDLSFKMNELLNVKVPVNV